MSITIPSLLHWYTLRKQNKRHVLKICLRIYLNFIDSSTLLCEMQFFVTKDNNYKVVSFWLLSILKYKVTQNLRTLQIQYGEIVNKQLISESSLVCELQ